MNSEGFCEDHRRKVAAKASELAVKDAASVVRALKKQRSEEREAARQSTLETCKQLACLSLNRSRWPLALILIVMNIYFKIAFISVAWTSASTEDVIKYFVPHTIFSHCLQLTWTFAISLGGKVEKATYS